MREKAEERERERDSVHDDDEVVVSTDNVHDTCTCTHVRIVEDTDSVHENNVDVGESTDDDVKVGESADIVRTLH